MVQQTSTDFALTALQFAGTAIPLWVGALKFYFDFVPAASSLVSVNTEEDASPSRRQRLENTFAIVFVGAAYAGAILGLLFFNVIVAESVRTIETAGNPPGQIYSAIYWVSIAALLLVFAGLMLRLYRDTRSDELSPNVQNGVFMMSAGVAVVITFSILFLTGLPWMDENLLVVGLGCFLLLLGIHSFRGG